MNADKQKIEAIEQYLIAVFKERTGGRWPITPKSAVYHDLFVVGDDLLEVFRDIKKEYEVSFRAFNFDTYVPNEATALWYRFARQFGFKTRFPKLTIEHLARVVERREWFEPDNAAGH